MIRNAARRSARLVAAAVAIGATTATTMADPVADFYRGNTIRHYVSTAPGGGYDLRSRLFMKYFPKHVPGSPNIVIVNMPGAAGVTMANWATAQAPRDGSMTGMPNMT